jgi:DNA-directed RNA polymerase specialized sigma24 family protein
VRAAAGQYDLHEPAQLTALLVRMAVNKFTSQTRRLRRQRRDARRTAGLGDQAQAMLEPGPGPDRQAELRDLLAVLRAGLTDAERGLADRRAAGRTWDEIAAELGGDAQTLRKQLTRAVKRLAPKLGLADDGGGDDA